MTIPVFDELKTLIRVSGLPLAALAKEAGVDVKLLRSWLNGPVTMPRLPTMFRVAIVLRRHVELTGNVQKMLKFYELRGLQ